MKRQKNKPQNYIQRFEENEVSPETGEQLDYDTVLTIPDQSLSIRQIIDRFTLGEQVDGLRNVYFDEGDDFETDDTLRPDFDLVDAEELLLGASDESTSREESSSAASDVASEAKQGRKEGEADEGKDVDSQGGGAEALKK